jgi:hypothetical protein
MKEALLRFGLGLIGMSPYQDDQIPAARHRLQRVVTYEVLADHFDRIEQEARSIGTDLQLACAFIPVALMLTVTLKTVTISNERVYDSFFSIMVLCYLMGAITGYRAWLERGRLKKFMNWIRAQQIGPVGQQGNELRPSDLAALPLEPAPSVQMVAEVVESRVVESQVTSAVESTPAGEEK